MSNDHDEAISDEQVKDYLINNPDFFEENLELVENLQLPHESGKAISLVERQVTVLRERNIELRQRLKTLMDSARANEKLFEKTKRLALILLDAEDLPAMVDTLYESLRSDYQVEYISLLLFGDNSLLSKNAPARVVSLDEANQHIGTLLRTNRSICGVLRNEEMTFLFDHEAAEIGSAAVPLQHGQAFGVLAVGNTDPNYYRSSMGTLFLNYIAEMLNQLMPRYLD